MTNTKIKNNKIKKNVNTVSDYIRILNHYSSPVVVEGRNKQFVVNPKDYSENTPGFLDLLWDDIDMINAKSRVFKSGILGFTEEDADDVYTALEIDKSAILFYDDFKDMILNPSCEKMEAILNITDHLIIGRIKGVLHELINSNVDVGNKIIKLIDERYREVSMGIKKSKITLKESEEVIPVDKKEVIAMKSEIEELRALVEKLTNS
jgi:hypothetical protein